MGLFSGKGGMLGALLGGLSGGLGGPLAGGLGGAINPMSGLGMAGGPLSGAGMLRMLFDKIGIFGGKERKREQQVVSPIEEDDLSGVF